MIDTLVIAKITLELNFPYFTACDWLHASESVNADWLIFMYRT